MRVNFGSLSITVRYVYPRGGSLIFQRAVPTDLRHRYPGATIKKDLKTSDFAKAARLVDALNRRIEAEWEGLRAAPEASPKALRAHADDFLRKHGLTAGDDSKHDPQAIALLHDYIDAKRVRHANGDEQVYREAGSSEYLSPVEIEAGRRLHGKRKDTLEDLLEAYLRAHDQRDDERFTTYQRRAFATLIAVTGDREVATFARADARRYVEVSLEGGSKTGTIRRRINSFAAMWTSYRLEQDPSCVNPFEKLSIPGEGEDKVRRVPFKEDELRTLIDACRSADDDRRWIIAMLADTGARLAEIVGLAVDDFYVDAEIPYVWIRPHPWRRLKNAESKRVVPLVGSALWAAKRVLEEAAEGQQFAFPRYTSVAECLATHASNTLAKWIRARGLAHTSHDLRHTMKDRLREVQCPKPIYDALLGHALPDKGEGYGVGYSAKVNGPWLAKTIGATTLAEPKASPSGN